VIRAGNQVWQVEVELLPRVSDAVGIKVEKNLPWLGVTEPVKVRTRRLFLLCGDLDEAGARDLAARLFTDAVVERSEVFDASAPRAASADTVVVFRRPGVMDPAEASILRGAARLGHPLAAVRTGTAYVFQGRTDEALLRKVAVAFLSNPAIEEARLGELNLPAPAMPSARKAARVEVPLREAGDAELLALSKKGGLSLSLVEMQAVRDHFRRAGREPTDLEIETIAQTWSEHCKHKTMAGPIRFQGTVIENLLQATIKHATEKLARPFCLSVFHDNAGVVRFDDDDALCIKVETHNHPSAIEPYGGAGTGVGGVIRDVLGCGRGARPVANLDVFCVGPLDLEPARLPKGALHPLRVLRGVVAGVRDYGNQMGIPTVNGAIVFEERYVGNPLVFCGTVGLLPRSAVTKEVRPGDRIVAIGGRTGRDGIHGATFSSAELHEESETMDSGAVQIGNAITEKKVADVVLQARDRGLFRAITDCGAGGFSSAVGEMGETCGARVELESAPLKYEGLLPAEIWISEAQERMVLAVPPNRLDELLDLCKAEDVEAAVLGEFTDTGRLEVSYAGEKHGDLDMRFLHKGIPKVVREAAWEPPPPDEAAIDPSLDLEPALLSLLGSPDVASKEWVIRQYDHEVQGGSAVKPLVGVRGHGPSDAAVVAPKGRSLRGFALGVGLNPKIGDLDPYAMAEAAIDEAVRNVVSVGGDPDACAILDNFAWGNTSKPDRLGALVLCAVGCRDAALALRTPFVSGKDSLNNEFQTDKGSIAIPHTLLVTALAIVPDVRQAVTMDLKAGGNRLVLLGATRAELGGSSFHALSGRRGAGPPRLNGERARRLFLELHAAIRAGAVRSCHDLSDGGLLVAAAEMVLAGGVGARLDLRRVPVEGGSLNDVEIAFSESLTRFLLEVDPMRLPEVEKRFAGLPFATIGETTADPTLEVAGTRGTTRVRLTAAALDAAWRPPLTRRLEGDRAS
jgi:phosphoribosylformylglycinamidine synthase subunit PurSL